MAEKPKPKRPKLTDKRQSERFIEAARKLESDETGALFEAAIKTLLPVKHGRKSKTARN